MVLQDFEQLPFPFDYLMQTPPSIPLPHFSFACLCTSLPPLFLTSFCSHSQNRPNRNPHQNRHPSTSPLRHRAPLKRRRGRRPSSRTRPPSRAVGAGGGVGGLAAAEGEVGAGQARSVSGVDDDGAVAEEGGGAGGGGEVEVEEAVGGVSCHLVGVEVGGGLVGGGRKGEGKKGRGKLEGDEGGGVGGLPSGEGAHHDFSMLAGQVAHLACLRHGRVARGFLAADVGV